MPKNDTLRTAVVQLDVVAQDIQANLERHLDFIAQARARDVRVLVFPELSLTGYRLRSHALGMPYDSEVLSRLAEAAGDMFVVVGFIEEGFAAQHFNSAAVVHNRKIVHLHRKLNLATYGDMEEGKYFAAGRYLETFEVENRFNAAVLICSDMWNPGLVHLAAVHGATLLLVPTNSSLDAISGDDTKPGRWDIFLRHYSTIYGQPIAFANRIGTEGGFTFWGGSRIFDAFGNILASAERDEECLLVADLSYEDVCRARFELPTVRDSNLGLIQREIDRLASRLGVPEKFRDL
jgi:predicted amidohydrolase